MLLLVVRPLDGCQKKPNISLHVHVCVHACCVCVCVVALLSLDRQTNTNTLTNKNTTHQGQQGTSAHKSTSSLPCCVPQKPTPGRLEELRLCYVRHYSPTSIPTAKQQQRCYASSQKTTVKSHRVAHTRVLHREHAECACACRHHHRSVSRFVSAAQQPASSYCTE